MFDHIVLISLDTLRSDCVAANPFKLWPDKYPEGQAPRTEALDELARGGAFFPLCASAAPYTSASHASLFTGKWPLRHGLFEFFNRKLAARTLFERARRLGYRTLFKTDFPVILGSFLGFDRGVDDYLVEDDQGFLDRLAACRRSVSFVHFGGLHVPYGFHNLAYGGQAYVDKVRELEAEIPPAEASPVDQLVETYRDPADLDLLLRYKRIVQHHYAAGRYGRLFSLYLEGVETFLRSRFQPFLERLLDRLRGSRHLLVVFGDHGEEYDADSYGHHNSLAEGVLRVPLIFYGTDVRSRLHARRVRTVDVAPTLLEALGDRGAASLRMDGESLAGAVWGEDEPRVRSAFAQVYAADARDYLAYQKRLLGAGRKTGSLRHVLFKEAIYEEGFKLTRQGYHYSEGGGIWGLEPCPPRTTLESLGDDGRPRPARDREIEARLSERLDAYNRLRARAGAELTVPDEIRRQLRDMGYRI